jgi:electron transfer flavoprotein alpha subunit
VTPVWVLAETEAGPDLRVAEATREALGEATDLARPARPGVLAVAARDDADRVAAVLAPLAGLGAGRLVVLETAAPALTAELTAALAAAWLAAAGAPVLLLGDTRFGRDAAPHLATRLDAALLSDALAARRAPDASLAVTRPAHRERLHATHRVAPGVAAVVALRPGALGVGASVPGPAVSVERVAAPTPAAADPGRTARGGRIAAADPRTTDLREAERIVAGGRGVGGPEGMALLQELADLLGAGLGGSRVAVDLGWLPPERQIGQSGRTVTPRLYLACGISGASQHLLGIRAAGTVVAIDTDPRAPILEVAHLGVLADWRPVVTALIARLRARAAPPPA